MTHVVAELPLPILQEWFLAVTTHPVSATAGIAEQGLICPPCDIEQLVKPSESQTANERLEIYHRSYFSRLIECLADDYPVVRYSLGDEGFTALCRRYIVECPSNNPNLNAFGRHFPQFVLEHGMDTGPFAHDLARLEWALVEVIHASTPGAVGTTAIASVAGEKLALLRFVASPAARLLTFEFPVNDYVTAFFVGHRPSLPDRKPTVVAVVRSWDRIHRIELEPNPARLLGRLLAGEKLGSALDGIDVTPDQLQGWFQDWTKSGMFASVLVE